MSRRMALVGLLLVGSLALAADAPKKAPYEAEWLAVSVEQGGKKLPDEEVKRIDLRVIVEGGKYTLKHGDRVVDRGTVKVTEPKGKQPGTIDVTPGEGENKGKVILAIYAIDGDTMKVCYDTEGKERPKEFRAVPGTGQVFIVYQRQKK